jgi:hypothetical protein
MEVQAQEVASSTTTSSATSEVFSTSTTSEVFTTTTTSEVVTTTTTSEVDTTASSADAGIESWFLRQHCLQQCRGRRESRSPGSGRCQS